MVSPQKILTGKRFSKKIVIDFMPIFEISNLQKLIFQIFKRALKILIICRSPKQFIGVVKFLVQSAYNQFTVKCYDKSSVCFVFNYFQLFSCTGFSCLDFNYFELFQPLYLEVTIFQRD